MCSTPSRPGRAPTWSRTSWPPTSFRRWQRTSALRLIRALSPEVALIDISMPELNGLDVTAHALRQQPQLKVIIVSMHASEAYVIEALRAGATGYLLKNVDADELERAIRAAARGERCLTPSVPHHVIDRFMRAERGEETAEAEALAASASARCCN